MPLVVRRSGQRVQSVEAGCGEGHVWRGARRHLPEDADKPTPVLHEVWWPSHDGTPDARLDRRVRGNLADTELRARRSRQLRRDGAADEGWPSQVQGLPEGVR